MTLAIRKMHARDFLGEEFSLAETFSKTMEHLAPFWNADFSAPRAHSTVASMV